MTQLPALADNQVPAPIARDLADALAYVANALSGDRTLPAERAPSPGLRSRLLARSEDLAGWLAPVGPTEALAMIAALLMVLPGQGSKGSVQDAARVQTLYVRALAGVPYFALRAACAEALTRGVGGKKFAPSPAELRAQAEREAQRWRDEAQKIRRVLEAKIEAPRPPTDVRKASAAAARRLFRIPEGGLSAGQPHREPDSPDSVGALAAAISAKSQESYERWKAEQRGEERLPPDRFADDDRAAS